MTDSGGRAEYPGVAQFEEMFRAETPFVCRALLRLGVPERDLEDLSHEVFMTAYRRLADFDAARPARPWLLGIAFHTALRYRQLARHRREVPEGAEAVDAGPGIEEQVAARQDRELLLKALETVDLAQRAVFVLHDIEGSTMPEVARTLSVPLNTAYSRLRLARAGVRAALAQVRRRDS